MAKVSVELRGWRFEEPEIFTDEGEFEPPDKIPEDLRGHPMRLVSFVEESCDTCYLIRGDEEIQQYQQAAIVYGEPREGVLLCEHHEPDFLYWFRKKDDRNLAGGAVLADAFHEWFAVGGRASDGYDGLECTDAKLDEPLSPPDANEIQRRLKENFVEGERVNLRDYGPGTNDEGGTPLTEGDLDGVGLDTDYPVK